MAVELDDQVSEGNERPQARWRSRLALALVAIVVVAVGVSIYRDRSNTTPDSVTLVSDVPPAIDCSTSAQPPAVDSEDVSLILQELGPVASVRNVDIGCGSYTVQGTVENAGQVVVSYRRSSAPPAIGPPSTTTDDGVEVWIVHGQPNSTEAIRSVVASRSDSITVTVPAPDLGPIASLTDAELEAFAVKLVQLAPT